MRWPRWLRRRWKAIEPDPQPATELLGEQQAKLRDLRLQRPEAHRQINQFAAEVEAAMRRRQQR